MFVWPIRSNQNVYQEESGHIVICSFSGLLQSREKKNEVLLSCTHKDTPQIPLLNTKSKLQEDTLFDVIYLQFKSMKNNFKLAYGARIK